MKTLADLKRFLVMGSKVKLVSRNGEALDEIKEVVKVQGNGIYFKKDGSPSGKSWLDFPKSSLLEITEKGFTIYGVGKRKLTEKEREIISNEPVDKKQDEIDMLTDGSMMFRRRKAYYKEKNADYLFGFFKDNMIRDNKVRGDKVLEYIFI